MLWLEGDFYLTLCCGLGRIARLAKPVYTALDSEFPTPPIETYIHVSLTLPKCDKEFDLQRAEMILPRQLFQRSHQVVNTLVVIHPVPSCM